jgi:Mn2+/Fe2+ NRAMP family transporter
VERDSEQRRRRSLFQVFGPGLISGASDDDPAGIGTYSQAGAQFGFGLLWTLLFAWPLMSAIQEIAARIGDQIDKAKADFESRSSKLRQAQQLVVEAFRP